MRRRDFLGVVSSAAMAWPSVARAQRPAMPLVGWLSGESRESDAYRVFPFRQGLKEGGYTEGQNLAIEYRFAEGQYDKLPILAADLVRRQVGVIACGGIVAAIAAKTATTTIPVVFQIADDPVRLGLVASLSRLGGNMTGVTSINVEVGPKQIEWLHEVAPNVRLIALLVNPNNRRQTEATTAEAQAASHRFGFELHVMHARSEPDFDSIFATLVKLRVDALLIAPDSLFANGSGPLGALAHRHGIPAISPYREVTAAGGLMSYGTSIAEQYRLVGSYTVRVLKGEKPAELPVVQPTRFQFVINLKTAKSLGLTVPFGLLNAADEVIE